MSNNQQPEALRLAEQLRDMCSIFKTPSHERGVVNGAIQELRRQHARISELEEMLRREVQHNAGLKAARIAYASEFEPDADGDPDVGNIHANIRALKAQLSTIALLPDGGRILRPLVGAKSWLSGTDQGGHIWLKTPAGDAEIFLTRHPNKEGMRHFPEEVGRWSGEEMWQDTTGTLWRRTVHYVTSDTGLGDLVEVQL